MKAVEISRSALDVEWQRLQVIANNLANLNTTRTASGEAFHPMRLVSGPDMNFASMLAGGRASGGRVSGGTGGVRVMGIEASGGNLRRVHEPGHPHADAEGYVSYPEIDHAGEMTLMIKTSRAYEANLTTMNIARQMYARALELGKQS